jgi:hypothetical protein
MIGFYARLLPGEEHRSTGQGLYGKGFHMAAALWQGTAEEYTRLHQAVGRNCDCTSAVLGVPPQTCVAHSMLAEQSTLDHLLYVYRTRRVFITRELYAYPIESNGLRRGSAALDHR